MTRVFSSIGKFSVKFRYLVIAAWLLAVYLLVAFGTPLSSIVKTNNSTFLPKNAPSIQAANLANKFQNVNDSLIVMVAYRNDTPLTPQDQIAIEKLDKSFLSVPSVIKAQVLSISKDGEAAQSEILSTTSQFDQTKVTSLVKDLRAKISSSTFAPGLQVHLAGQLATAVDQSSSNNSTASNSQLFSVLVILLILFAVFRSLLAPFLTLIPALIVSIAAGPVVAWASKLIGFQVSFVAQILLIILVLGAGTDYGLFLVFRVREELRKGLNSKEAVATALTKVGESITFSGLTVIAALLSLTTASFGFYSGLGYPLAIAITMMLLAGLTLLPALLAVFGRAAFWPSRTRVVANRDGLWGRIAGKIIARPILTLAIGLVVFGSLAVASFGNSPSGFASTSTGSKTADSTYGNNALSAHFPSSNFNPTTLIYQLPASVWTNTKELSQVAGLQRELSTNKAFTHFVGPLNPLGLPLSVNEISSLYTSLGNPHLLPVTPPPNSKIPNSVYQSYRSLSQFITPGGTTVLFNTLLSAGDPASNTAIDAIPHIRAVATTAGQQFGAVKSGVAGEAPAAYDISSASNSDLFKIVPIVVVIIGLLLAIVLRSAVAPFYLVISVVLSYLAALGLDVLVFIKIKHDHGLTFVLPFLLFLFLLALGEDYNILVMTRIREEAHHHGLKEAVRTAIGATGTVVTSAGIVLAATFFVLGTAGSGGSAQVQEIGLGLALGILMDTFLVRTLLVPSAVVLIGKYNWWPSSLFKEHVIREQETADDLELPPAGIAVASTAP